jgi:outer membrane receptor protein involved in Fe transport
MTIKTEVPRGREALLMTCALVALTLTASPTRAQEADHHDEDEEVAVEDIIVQATRSRRRVQDEPIRVEVIPQEEIEEKLLMRPGNISMILAETGGLRVQTTSPSLGGANVRVQGMRGRYTQLLSDGLPLFGGTASSLGLLQIPPSDLGRVEVIKGSASALYGGSALGGVINLVSRHPGDETAGELILNATTRNGQDLSAYGATPLVGGWSGSVLMTANRQTADDMDGDGWADLAAYERATLRPRLFWFGDDGSSLFLTAGMLDEDRRGGTLDGAIAPDGRPFPEDQETRRVDAGLVYERPLGEAGLWQVRAAAVDVDHRHVAGDVTDDDHHLNGLIESSVSLDAWGSSWLIGAAVQNETYRSEAFSVFDYDFTTPGLFAQVERDFREGLTLAASARWVGAMLAWATPSARAGLRPAALSIPRKADAVT